MVFCEASLDLSVIEDFRLTKKQAHSIIKDAAGAVTKWRKAVKQLGLKESDIEKMSSAFEHEDFVKAKKLM
ncbi:MAG: hypothetical protein FWH43_08145 [Endomicrobia bacterium]|nr:hypothetical protein [Endomicrobiia bacterium]